MEQIKQNAFSGLKDVGQAERIYNRFARENNNDDRMIEDIVLDLLRALRESDTIYGDDDDFHNFAGTCSNTLDDNRAAYDIVYEGLKLYPTNTDLLADAIKYGYSCGEKDKCKLYYETLVTIDKAKWTWRAFSFAIDYLLDEWSSKDSEYSVEDMLSLAEEYKQTLPDEEDEVYDGTNQKEKGISILEEAISKFTFCPRCWLRYADLMIDRGEYAKAEPVIKKMLMFPKSKDKINPSYMFYLDAQCKLYTWRSSEAYENGEINKAQIMCIYRAFRKALSASGLRASTKRQIEDNIVEIENETDIEFPEDWKYSVRS